jgi:hypothetical protein
MGKVFGGACALGIIVGVVLWGYGAFVVGVDVAKSQKAVEKSKTELSMKANRSGDIKNQLFIDDVREYQTALANEETELKKLMLSRETQVDNEALGLPLNQFRQYVEKKYAEEDKLLADSGVAFPANQPNVRGHVFSWENVQSAEKARVLRDAVVTGEVVRALVEANAEVSYSYVDKDGKKHASTEKRTVDQLKSVKFVGSKDQPVVPVRVEETGPFHEVPVKVTLYAHYAVLLDAIHRLEKSQKCVLIVRSAVVKSQYDVYSSNFPEELRDAFTDTREHENPVEAELTIVLLEFPKAHAAENQEG